MAAHRYWRIYITANNGDAYTAISEIEFRATAGGTDLTWPAMTTAQSSAYSGWGADRAVNNNTGAASNSWVTDGGSPPHWASFDFASGVSPVELVIYGEPGQANRSPKDFLVQYSDDGTSWATLVAITGAIGWTDSARTFSLVTYPYGGTARDDSGAPAARKVRLHHRGTGAVLDEVTSDSVSGAYVVTTNYAGECYVVFMDDDAGATYNDKIARVRPA